MAALPPNSCVTRRSLLRHGGVVGGGRVNEVAVHGGAGGVGFAPGESLLGSCRLAAAACVGVVSPPCRRRRGDMYPLH